MPKTKFYTLGLLIVFLMIYIISFYQVYSSTDYNTSLNLSSDNNTDSWSRIVKEGPQLYRSSIEIINNHTYVIGTIGEYLTSDDIYLAKFDSSGAKVWEQTWDGAKYDYIYGYVIDTDNNIYIAGISSLVGFWHSRLSGSIFLLKYNTTGNLLWSKTLDPLGSNKYKLHSIQTGLNNSIYISSTTVNYPNNTVIITKLNSSGNIFWMQEIEQGSYIDNLKTQIDSIGNIYLFGDNESNSILFKLNASGSIQWEYDLGEDESNFQMKIDYEDNIILTSVDRVGSNQYELYLTKINSTGNLIKRITNPYASEKRKYGVWFLDNIFILVGSSLFEYNYSLDTKWNVTFGNNTTLDEFGSFHFGITSNQKMYLIHYRYLDYFLRIIEFNRSGIILSKLNWGGLYYFRTIDTSIDSQGNLYMVCSIGYINVWREATVLIFLVKNPKTDAIAIYLDQNIEDGEIFLFSILGFSCFLSLILVFMTLKPKLRQFKKKRFPV